TRSLCDWSSDVCSSDLLGIFEDLPAAFQGQLGFQCSRNFVKTRMNDVAVVTRRFLAEGVVLLDECNRQIPLRQLACDGATDDSCAYDADVEHRSGKSVKIPSIPSSRKRDISAGSLTVQT